MRWLSTPIRWTIRALTILSWGVLALALVMWIRSAWVADWWHFGKWADDRSGHAAYTTLDIFSGGGSLLLRRSASRYDFSVGDIDDPDADFTPSMRWHRTSATAGRKFWSSEFESEWGYKDRDRQTHYVNLEVPYWLLILLCLPLVILSLYRLRGIMVRRRRKVGGFCIVCGYDLRATPGRCPECGTAPKARKFTAAETSPPAGG